MILDDKLRVLAQAVTNAPGERHPRVSAANIRVTTPEVASDVREKRCPLARSCETNQRRKAWRRTALPLTRGGKASKGRLPGKERAQASVKAVRT